MRKYIHKLFGHRFIETIDELSMYAFMKVHETGQLHYIIKQKRLYGNGVLAWNKLYNEYLSRFGISERLENYLNLLKEQIGHIAKARLENDPLSCVKEVIVGAQIEEIEKAPKMDFNEQNAALEKYMGIAIDLKRTTVSEYMGKVKLMQSDGRKN